MQSAVRRADETARSRGEVRCACREMRAKTAAVGKPAAPCRRNPSPETNASRLAKPRIRRKFAAGREHEGRVEDASRRNAASSIRLQAPGSRSAGERGGARAVHATGSKSGRPPNAGDRRNRDPACRAQSDEQMKAPDQEARCAVRAAKCVPRPPPWASR